MEPSKHRDLGFWFLCCAPAPFFSSNDVFGPGGPHRPAPHARPFARCADTPGDRVGHRAGAGPSKSTHVPPFVRSCRVHRVVAFLPVFHRHVVDRLSAVVHDLLARRVRLGNNSSADVGPFLGADIRCE